MESVPEIEYRDGLFHVTEYIGGVTLRRVYAPHTFLRATRHCQDLARQFLASEGEKVVQIAAG